LSKLIYAESLGSVYLADAIELMKEQADSSVDLFLTDIPYDEVNRKSAGLRKLDRGAADILTFSLDEFLREAVRITRGHLHIFCGTEQVSTIMRFFREQDFPRRVFPLKKLNPSPMNGNRMPLSAVEMACWAKKRGAPYYGHCVHNLIEGKSSRSKLHPTEKPLEVVEALISLYTAENDLVFDPCCGSGTTGVAAIKTKRRFIIGDNNVTWAKAAVTRCSSLG